MNSISAGAVALSLCLSISAIARADEPMNGGMSGMPAQHHDHAKGNFGHPASAKKASRSVEIAMGDLSFTPDAVTVKSGETILFVVHNSSATDHDFTLGDKATQEAHRKEMAEMGEMPMHHHHGGNALTVKAGKTAKLAWTFGKPGVVDYDCNVPGHYEAGMAGKVTVTP